MPLVPDLADVEAVLVAHVAADADVVALGADSATDLPVDFPSSGAPFAQVFRVGGTDVASGHVDRALVQVNAYGSSRGEAFDVARACARALVRAETTSFAGAVVTAVLRLSGPAWSPDPITNAPRYTTSFAVTVHPTA